MRKLGAYTPTDTREIVDRGYVDARAEDGYCPPSGGWMQPDNLLSTAASTPALGGVYWSPFTVGPNGLVISALGVMCTTAYAGGAGVTETLGLYPDDGTGGAPLLTSLLTSGTVDLSAASTTIARSYAPAGGTLALAPGRYWAASLYRYTTAPSTAPQLTGISNATALWVANGVAFGVSRSVYLAGQTTLPTTAQSLTTQSGGNAPVIALRAA